MIAKPARKRHVLSEKSMTYTRSAGVAPADISSSLCAAAALATPAQTPAAQSARERRPHAVDDTSYHFSNPCGVLRPPFVSSIVLLQRSGASILSRFRVQKSDALQRSTRYDISSAALVNPLHLTNSSMTPLPVLKHPIPPSSGNASSALFYIIASRVFMQARRGSWR